MNQTTYSGSLRGVSHSFIVQQLQVKNMHDVTFVPLICVETLHYKLL